MQTNIKMTISGNCISTLITEVAISYGYLDTKHKVRIRQTDPEKVKATRTKTLQKVKSYVKKLISKNNWYWRLALGKAYNPELFTITFRENMQDLDFANREHSKFLQTLKYFMKTNFNRPLHYVSVPEFQKRGAIHYHILIFNMPFVPRIYDTLRPFWVHGSLNIQSVKEIKNVASYVCKYMLKDAEDQRLTGRKCYFRSRDLAEPVIIRNPEEALKIVAQLPEEFKAFEKEYANEYHQAIHFTEYVLPYEHPLLQKIN